MSIKNYVLGGPRCKPPGVSRGSPRLHIILMCMLMQLFVCCDRNKVQFNSNSIQFKCSVSISVTGKMSWGHITPVSLVGRLT